ncbi:MAG TPA: ATP-binding protein, partial [Acidimicrobiales bacterium]|nr:ATP-binding protein [Acidimicrobiales bacterium]
MPEVRPTRTRVGQWWLDLPVRRKGLLVVAAPIVVTLVALGAAIVAQHRADEARARGRTTTMGLEASTRLVQDVTDAESALRGYAAVTDRAFLDEVEAATHRTRTAAADLRRDARTSVGDDPEVAEALRRATAAADVAGEVLDGEVADARAAGTGAPVDLGEVGVAVGRVRAAGDELRPRLATQLADRRDEVDDLGRLSLGVMVAGLAGGALVGVVVTGVALRSILGRVETLSGNVDRFAAGRPLVPMVSSDDEIGRLSSELRLVAQVIVHQQAELEESRDRALAATRAKDEFLSRTSHELRTPLTSIIGFGQLLGTGSDLSADDRESVEHIVRAGHHLRELIDEVLDIARIEAGKVDLDLEPLAVAEVAADATALVRPQAASAGVDVAVDLSSHDVVTADRQRLRQVLINLLSNAIKYNHPGGRAVVSRRPGPPGRVVVGVSDTGPGIAPDMLERVFAPFDRLGAERSGVEGTGVGLALSRTLVEAMGGTLDVESRPGQGSTFLVDLPAPAREAEPAAAAGAGAPRRSPPPAPTPAATTTARDRAPGTAPAAGPGAAAAGVGAPPPP